MLITSKNKQTEDVNIKHMTLIPELSIRTYEVLSEQVLSNVFKERGEDRQQSHCGVVDDLGGSSRLLSAVGELTQLQVLLCLLQILRCTIKVRP